jgi:hypothetical protein
MKMWQYNAVTIDRLVTFPRRTKNSSQGSGNLEWGVKQRKVLRSVNQQTLAAFFSVRCFTLSNIYGQDRVTEAKLFSWIWHAI